MKEIIFLFVDHFEPEDFASVVEWVRRYPTMAKKHVDADGVHPKHTWFYDGEDPGVIERLSRLTEMGFGEVEIHLHHSNDKERSFIEKIERRKKLLGDRSNFAFIHGGWSLDNSRGDKYCGINNELKILSKLGCFADFTFPAWGKMQPEKKNSIYYATDNPTQPKSYNNGEDAEVGGDEKGDLMIFQGPGNISGFTEIVGRMIPIRVILERFFLSPDISFCSQPTPKKIIKWINSNVHVIGKDDWIFVKVHTHGARRKNFPMYFGDWADRLFYFLKHNYRVHYVTAREAYNIVRATEAGEEGSPNQYRDYIVKPYK